MYHLPSWQMLPERQPCPFLCIGAKTACLLACTLPEGMGMRENCSLSLLSWKKLTPGLTICRRNFELQHARICTEGNFQKHEAARLLSIYPSIRLSAYPSHFFSFPPPPPFQLARSSCSSAEKRETAEASLTAGCASWSVRSRSLCR
jgi:hypothetical protein